MCRYICVCVCLFVMRSWDETLNTLSNVIQLHSSWVTPWHPDTMLAFCVVVSRQFRTKVVKKLIYFFWWLSARSELKAMLSGPCKPDFNGHIRTSGWRGAFHGHVTQVDGGFPGGWWPWGHQVIRHSISEAVVTVRNSSASCRKTVPLNCIALIILPK